VSLEVHPKFLFPWDRATTVEDNGNG